MTNQLIKATGDTYNSRKLLKDVGFTWSRVLKTWVISQTSVWAVAVTWMRSEGDISIRFEEFNAVAEIAKQI